MYFLNSKFLSIILTALPVLVLRPSSCSEDFVQLRSRLNLIKRTNCLLVLASHIKTEDSPYYVNRWISDFGCVITWTVYFGRGM